MSNEIQHVTDTLNRLCAKVDGLTDKQAATSEGLAVVASKLDDVRREAAERDEVLKEHAQDIKGLTECTTEIKTGIKLANFLGTSGIFAGMCSAIVAYITLKVRGQ